ncbi:uncharacterized protein METZ01_LOCUS348014 [marine metagenome]|uniref:Uncharacterized protein n=1 Tax=marine metagenome TaxID=408172 RepID=A0A382RCS2_9ZZZZ
MKKTATGRSILQIIDNPGKIVEEEMLFT